MTAEKTSGSYPVEDNLDANQKHKPFITVKEARKVLGTKITRKIDDNMMEKIVFTMEQIAKLLIVNVIKPTNTKEESENE